MAIQRSFISGEIGGQLYGGADQPRYQSGLATCRNFLVMRHGGIANRPGTVFVGEVKDSAVRTYGMKFIFNPDETYFIEVGEAYFRFYRQGARVVVSGLDAWADATPYVQGDLVELGGVNYYAIVAHTSVLANDQPGVGANWEDFWYPLVDDIFEIPTPYQEDDLGRLQYDQSGDILTIVNRNYAPMELRRYQDRWTLTTVLTTPSIAAPANPQSTPGTGGALPYSYKITAVKADSYEESLPSDAVACPCGTPVPATPNVQTWDVVAGAVEYNVYLDWAGNGVYGFIGVAASNSFNDIGYEPDFSLTPPIARSLFATATNYPQAVSHYQQRRGFASSDSNPEQVWLSRIGFYSNFGISSPSQDDDAVTFTPAGRFVCEIRHMIDLGRPILLTSTMEWIARGDQSGAITPTIQNLEPIAYWGASHVVPVIVGKTIIYVQARGGIVRDLQYAQILAGNPSYEGRDLTLFAPHLVEGYALDRMDYAQIPHSIVWAVRSDGTLLGLTYLREFDVWGWHRHDTEAGNGIFEEVVCLPETTPPPPGSATRGKEEDAVYVIVRRSIDGVTRRYVERFASRRFEDYRLDGIFLDAALTYNGINADSTTVTLSTGGGWTTADTITVTASAGVFAPGDVGKGVTVWIPGAGVTRIVIATYTSPTVVSGLPIALVPVDVRSVALTTWSFAIDTVTGLDHLEAKDVSILANGVVLSGTVAGGEVELGGLYDIVHVGLPITADFETLDIDSTDQSIRDIRKLIKNASLLVERSRGITAGPDEEHLRVVVPETGTVLPTDVFNPTAGALLNQLVEMNLQATWAKPGRIFVRQTDPLPLAILAVIPNGELGG